LKLEHEKLIEDFKGLECWAIVAGTGTGSIFTLGFGKKILRKTPLANPHLTFDQQNYDSEYSLMVWSSWSLFKEKILVCNSNSSNEKDGQMVVGLRELIGKKIKEITIKDTTLDLEIEFDSGYRMIVVPDGYDLYADDADNYVLFFPEFTMSVTIGLEIRRSMRLC